MLHAWDGMPMDEASLCTAVRAHAKPDRPTDSDVAEALKECEMEGYVMGVTDGFSKERSWSLTQKGEHQARQLR